MTKRITSGVLSALMMLALGATGCSRHDYLVGNRGNLNHGNEFAAKRVPAEMPSQGSVASTMERFAPGATGGGPVVPMTIDQGTQQAPFPDGVTPRPGLFRE